MVAIVHDYLTQRGGAERVVLSLSRAFPDSSIHTSVYDAASTFPEFTEKSIVASPLNRFGALRRSHRLGLPFYAATFDRMVVDADLTICSSSGWAHGARVTGHKIVYCHAPARWLYQPVAYLGGRKRARAMAPFLPKLLRWDARAARTADHYLANSHAVRARIMLAYGIDAEVVAPPHAIDPAGHQEPIEGIDDAGFFVCISRLLPYKNVAAVVAAFAELPHQLVVVGEGPLARSLQTSATDNVRFVPTVSDAHLRWLYQRARAVVAASYEDYGLTPVEGAAFGTPSVVLRWGGFLDTVIDGETGVFFEQPEPALIAAAVRRVAAEPPPRETLIRHSEQFSEQVFVARMRQVADDIRGA